MENNVLRNDNKELSKYDKEGRVMNDPMTAQLKMHEAWPDLADRRRVENALYSAFRFMQPLVQPRIKRKFTLRRVRSIHEGQARRIDGAEMDALDLAIIKEAKDEQKRLRDRLASLDAMLAVTDEAFHRETLAAIRSQARGQGAQAEQMGGDNRPRDL